MEIFFAELEEEEREDLECEACSEWQQLSALPVWYDKSNPGRPKIIIDTAAVYELLLQKYTLKEISIMHNISSRTISRRIKEDDHIQQDLSDAELEQLTKSFLAQMPAAECFLQAIRKFGVPQRIRTDKGGENILLAEEMYKLRPHSRTPILTGCSVQNVRIERLWGDVFRLVISRFKKLFVTMVDHGYLNQSSEIDLLALHLVFLPRIQTALNIFVKGWDYHGVRTSGSQTPLRLWTDGLLRYEEDLAYPRLVDCSAEIDAENFAVDYAEPMPLQGEAYEEQVEQVILHDI
ncbi:hypothetical protein RUND412_002623 [Rhizina undulata]